MLIVVPNSPFRPFGEGRDLVEVTTNVIRIIHPRVSGECILQAALVIDIEVLSVEPEAIAAVPVGTHVETHVKGLRGITVTT